MINENSLLFCVNYTNLIFSIIDFGGFFWGGEGGEAIQKDCYNEGGNITAFNKNPIKMKTFLYYIHCGYTVAEL